MAQMQDTVDPGAIPARPVTPWWQRTSKRRIFNMAIIYLLVLPGAVMFLIPLLWMLSTSLKESRQIFVNPPVWIPNPVVWQNFTDGWSAYLPFNTLFVNSTLITLNNIVGNLFSCCLAAFGFARLRARGRNVLFGLVLATMLLPNEVLIIPQYVLFTKITQFLKPWWDYYTPGGILWMRYLSWLPLMVPPWFGFPFFIFLLRQFFLTIPLDLDEAARLDGASSWRILMQILVPLTKPGPGHGRDLRLHRQLEQLPDAAHLHSGAEGAGTGRGP